MRCAKVRRELTALVDTAIEDRRSGEIRRHLDICGACRRELRGIEKTVGLQHAALRRELPELSPGFETRLRQRLAEEGDTYSRPRAWWGWWKPLVVGGMAAAGVLLAARPVGGPSTVLVPLGLQAPPPKLANEAELFLDYEIIEHLEVLEYFETVDTLPLEEQILGEKKGAA